MKRVIYAVVMLAALGTISGSDPRPKPQSPKVIPPGAPVPMCNYKFGCPASGN